MSDILSQDEVDKLLSGLTDGKIESPKEEAAAVEKEEEVALESGEVPGYDFASQDRVLRARMPTYDVINERYAREVRTSMSSLLQANVDISAESLDTLKFSEFVRSLPVPTSLHIFRMEPLRGYGLIVLESQLVFNLIDTFFGGKGTGQARIEGREFTSIEEAMVRKVVIGCLKDLEKAWRPVKPVKTSWVRSEVSPQFAGIVLPTDLVIVTKFSVELEQTAGVLSVCIPYSMIEPLRAKLSSGFQAETEEADVKWQESLKNIILDSAIEFSVFLGSTEITGGQLLSMKVGDIIQLDQDADKELVGHIEGVSKLYGFAGAQRGFQAFRVSSKIT